MDVRPPEKKIVPGGRIRFIDSKGRFVFGDVIDTDRLQVIASNVALHGTVLFKQPYWSWEQAVEVIGKGTALRPNDLLALSQLFEGD